MEQMFLPAWARYFIATVGAAAGYVFGGLDVLLKALIALAIIDYITGVSAAFFGKKLSSRVGLEGILRKTAMFAILAAANITDNITGAGGAVRNAVCTFYCANEGISILENCEKLGVPLPEKIYLILQKLKEEKTDE